MAQKFQTILVPLPLHIDTLVAVFLLKYFGETKLPGISQAEIKYVTEMPKGETSQSLEEKGIVCVDMGKGNFDHHRDFRLQEEETSSTLVAEYLNLKQDKAFEKLIIFVKRDDLKGQGIISQDRIDRAFGLPGLVVNLNRAFRAEPEKIMNIVFNLLYAHWKEEYQRWHLLPAEFEALKQNGGLEEMTISQNGEMFNVLLVRSDKMGLTGYLRARQDIKADIVAQFLSTGHVNIITNQKKLVNLRDLAVILRREEALRKGLDVLDYDLTTISQKGLVDNLEEWYLDLAAQSLQNGGVQPERVNPTRLNYEEMKRALQIGLNLELARQYIAKHF